MAEGDNWHVVEPREIGVLDRIGGGDGFVGGLLYAILKGWEPEKWIQFGWASGALATTMLTDYAQPADEEQVWSIWEATPACSAEVGDSDRPPRGGFADRKLIRPEPGPGSTRFNVNFHGLARASVQSP